MKEVVLFEKTETLVGSICSDLVTFSFLFLCMWFSYSQGGGWWAFFTCSIYLVWLFAGVSRGYDKCRLVLTSKRQAIEWAQSLPDDGSLDGDQSGEIAI